MGLCCAAKKMISWRLLGTNNCVISCPVWVSWLTRYSWSLIVTKWGHLMAAMGHTSWLSICITWSKAEHSISSQDYPSGKSPTGVKIRSGGGPIWASPGSLHCLEQWPITAHHQPAQHNVKFLTVVNAPPFFLWANLKNTANLFPAFLGCLS